MNELMLGTEEVKITSLQIAEITDKEHKNVIQKARKMMSELGEKGRLNFKPSSYLNSQNKEQPMIEFSKRGAIQFMASYDALLMDKLMDYIEELESKLKNTASYMIEDPIERAKRWIEEQQQVQLMAPKAEAYDDLLSVQKNQTMNQVAKVLGVGRNKLFKILRDNKILMKNNLPYQSYVDSRYFETRDHVIKRSNFEDVKPQTLVTTKGVVWINKKLKEWQIK